LEVVFERTTLVDHSTKNQSMFEKNHWKHLRIGFSFLLMPVFLFSLAITPNLNPQRLLIVFVLLHLFLFPSSNGYNSYFDKDEKSIGGLKFPPKVNIGLYYLSLVFFGIALILAAQINWSLVSMVLIYGLVSMAYSHPSIRLKKHAITSWFIAGFFQGFFTFGMAFSGLNDFGWEVFTKDYVLIPAVLTSLILWASYPLTQIYQHEEDLKRGDQTLSVNLGIKGTFAFSAVWFLITLGAFGWYFLGLSQAWAFYGLLAAFLPSIIFFTIWFYFVKKDEKKFVNYDWVMWMSRISAIGLNVFFVWYFLENTQILQVF
jgi:4-hydroxybenzoate polyprenyltransferase